MTQVAEDEEKKKRESEALAPLEDLIGDEEEEAEENEEDEEISLEFQRKGTISIGPLPLRSKDRDVADRMVLLTCGGPTEERLSQLQELRQKKLAMLRQKMGAQPADATTISGERTTMEIAPSKPKEEEDNDDEEEEEDEEEEDDDDGEDEYDWRAKLL